MIELTISEVARHPSKLRLATEKGTVLLNWKENKPGGKVIYSVMCEKTKVKKT